jgi:hypothetical protein
MTCSPMRDYLYLVLGVRISSRIGAEPPLAFKAHSQAACSLPERAFTALEDIADCLTNVSTFKASGEMADGRQLAWSMCPYLRDNELVGVRVNNQISVVRDHGHLTHGANESGVEARA